MASVQLPLYQQISELLYREISAGHWRPGERLPTEAELSKSLQVAVGTLRKALTQLEEDGWLERKQGSGTYVRQQPFGKAIYQFFHLELHDSSGIPSAEIIDVTSSKNREACKHLNAEELWTIKRKRFINKTLVAIEQIWIDRLHSKNLMQENLHESLYLHYRNHFGFWISRVEDEVTCEKPPKWVNHELELTDQSGITVVKRRSWSQEDEVKEYSVTWLRPKKCKYVARWS